MNANNTWKSKCIGFDLDETLVHTFEDGELKTMDGLLPEVRKRIYSLTMPDGSMMWGIVRPHAYEFIEFCRRNFKCIFVWSAGVKDYVHLIVQKLFGFSKSGAPVVVYSRGDCVPYQDEDGYERLKKPLRKLTSGALKRHDVTMNDILIIDDNETTFIDNPENVFHIPRYVPRPDALNFDDDDHLLRLACWMRERKFIPNHDVTTMDKTDAFKERTCNVFN